MQTPLPHPRWCHIPTNTCTPHHASIAMNMQVWTPLPLPQYSALAGTPHQNVDASALVISWPLQCSRCLTLRVQRTKPLAWHQSPRGRVSNLSVELSHTSPPWNLPDEVFWMKPSYTTVKPQGHQHTIKNKNKNKNTYQKDSNFKYERNISAHIWDRISTRTLATQKASVLLYPNNCTSFSAMVFFSHLGWMAEMADIEFKICIGKRLLRFRRKLTPNLRNSKEFNKMIQELKDKTAILRKNKIDFMELQTYYKDFIIQLEVLAAE